MKEYEIDNAPPDSSYNCLKCLDTGYFHERGDDDCLAKLECTQCNFHETEPTQYDRDMLEVKAYIKILGVTKMARMTGISRQTLYNILHNRHELSHRHYLIIMGV